MNSLMSWTRTILRLLFVFINNVYCIPVHVVWLLCLQPLHWFAESLYWKIEGTLFKWLLSMVALWSYSAGYNIVELGDDISDVIDEKTIVLFNHQSTADVPLIMAAFHSHDGMLENIMWIMDRIFKKTNFGVVSIGHGDFFIRAGKENREKSLEELAFHLKDFYCPRGRKWIALFPEGGFLKNRKPVSQQYAKKNDLPHLENVSLPRIGALKVILDEVNTSKSKDGIKYLVDVTIAYPEGRPLDLLTLVTGSRDPCNVIFHYKIFPVGDVPLGEKELTNWLYEIYYKKEALLQEYYDTGIFPPSDLDSPESFSKRLDELRIHHDPLQLILRHCFFITSSYLWCKIFYWLTTCLWNIIL